MNSTLRRTQVAWLIVVWGPLSIVLVLLNAPAWLRLPLVGTFTVLGVGIAAVLVLRITDIALLLSVMISVGVSTLIVVSLVFLYVSSFSSFGTLVVQAVLAWGLAALVLYREYREVADEPAVQ